MTITTNRRGQIEVWLGDEDEDGAEVLVAFPTKMEVCDRCRGTGSHVNPSIDGNGLDPHDPDLDEEFWDTYMSGGYDVVCEECRGRNVVPVVDEENCSPELLAAWHKYCQDEWESRAIDRAEARAFGY